ncbi:response regulator transcription factor [Pseudomonas sp. CR3202]|uniref:response regulator transcription factor n=1 Tax=Pseudomonas sp. CR3202 TaxID=3351532 RepID=UPI003BF18D47
MPETKTRNTAVIAIVDDDESVRTALDALLRSSGYHARTYCDALDFLNSDGPAETHCLISDIQMPGMSGLELHDRLVTMGLRLPTVFITAFPEPSPLMGNVSPDLLACLLRKPFEADKLLACVESALRRRS